MFFYFPASFTAFFPLVKLTWFQWFDLFFLIHFFFYISSFLYFCLLPAWVPGFPMFLIFFLFSGQCISLFPPVSFVFLYKTDLNNSLFQMVIQGHSEQKDESAIFHWGHYLSMWTWLLNNSSLLYFLVTWLHTGHDPVSKGSQKSSSSLDHHLFTQDKFSNASHRTGKDSIQSPSKSVGFKKKLTKLILKFTWKNWGTRIAKKNFFKDQRGSILQSLV